MSRSQGGLSGGIGRALSCLLLANTLSTSIAQTMHELVTTYEAGWIQDGVMFDVQTVGVDSTSTNASGGAAIGTTGPDGITIYGLNILTPLTETFCVELYTKSGSFNSAAFDADAWTFLGSFSLMGQGPTTPTPIPFGSFDPVTVGVDEVQAFYVTTQNEKLRYTALDDTDGRVTGDVYSESDPHYTSVAPATERTSGVSEGEEDEKKKGSSRTKGRGKSSEPTGQRAKRMEARGDRALQATGNKDGLTVQILTGVAKDYPFLASWPNRVFNGAIQYQLGQDASLGFLSDAQMAEAWSVKRGQVTCDVVAIPAESYPSVAPSDPPVPTSNPSKSPTPMPSAFPTKSPTPSPSLSPSSKPTDSPTTLESTVRKIATTLHGGMKQAGCMFDIRVPSVAEGGPPEGLTVLAVEMSTFLTDETCVEVYTKTGTYEGFENDVTQNADGTWSSATWSILGASTVVGKGEFEPTHVPIGHLDPVFVPPGSRQAFYVTLTEPEMRYTEPKYGEESGELFSGSKFGHIELLVGSAVAYPFEQAWKDRIFNGAVVYALGEVEDGKYNSMTAADRNRTCPMITESPTPGPTASPSKGPTASPVVTVVDVVETTTNATEAVATSATEASSGDIVDIVESVTDGPTKGPTASPSFGLTSTLDTPAKETPTARHADTCPGTIVTATSTSKDVIVPYEYTVITDAGKDVKDVITEMEQVLHQALMADMCSAPGNSGNAPGNAASPEKRKARALQEATYKGFNSNPTDSVTGEGCSSSVTLAEGQQCYVIEGGTTAVVDGNDDDEAVQSEVGGFVSTVFSDPMIKSLDGVQAVYVVSDGESTDNVSTDIDGNVEDTDGSTTDSTEGPDETDGGDRNFDGVQDGETPPADDTEPSKTLSTTGIIIIAVFASTFVLVALLLVAMRVRKKRRTMKRADSKELFHEFPDEAERGYSSTGAYGVSASSSAGYHESFAPLGMDPPPPPPGRPSTSMSNRSSEGVEQAVILNEDDMSLFSKNSRFAPSAVLASQQGMPRSSGSVGSRGSRGSNSSKKSVEFVRAGQSFSANSRASNQPEDTVDL